MRWIITQFIFPWSLFLLVAFHNEIGEHACAHHHNYTQKKHIVTHGVRAYGNATSRRTCRFTLRIHLHSWLLFAHHSSFILWEQACPKSKSPFHISPEGGRSPLTAWPVRVTPSDHILKGRLIKKSGVRGSLPASRTNGNLTIFPLNTKRCLPN